MEAKKYTSKALGLTQLQLAMLLGITRSRMSLFELGIRPLPENARQKLDEVCLAASKMENDSQKNETPGFDKVEFINELLESNKHNQKALAKTIKAMEEKHANKTMGLQLIQYLASVKTPKTELESEILKLHENEISKSLSTKGRQQLFESQIRLKTLQYEAQLLKEAIGGEVSWDYFPMQKFAKIFPSNSSLVTSPVISPK